MDEVIAQHPVHAALDTLLAKVNDAKAAEVDDHAKEILERIATVESFARRVIDSAQAALVSPGMLDNIQSQADAAAEDIRSFLQGGGQPAIDQANVYVDGIVSALGWGAILTPEAVTVAQEAATAHRRSMKQLVASARRDAESLDELVVEANKTAGDLETAIETEVQRVGTEVEAKYAPTVSRVNELIATIDRQTTRLDTALTNHQDNFTAAESLRSQRFDAFLTERDVASKDGLAEALTEYENTRTKLLDNVPQRLQSFTTTRTRPSNSPPP